MYHTLTGNPLQFTSQLEELTAEYVLQRFREVWVVTATRPYLAIDEDALRARMAGRASFSVLSAGTLFQNFSPTDISSRLLSALIGPGTTASTSPKSDALVEGEANPQAFVVIRWNPLLSLGTHPFAAFGTHYIFMEPGRIFQRKTAELVVVKEGGRARSEPRADAFDFQKQGNLLDRFHHARLGVAPSGDQDLYARMLDEIFVENIAVLAFVETHHASAPRPGPKYDYRAGELTRYGRLVHNDQGEPLIETSFALLHYEKALYEFDALKRATVGRDLERSYMHGVYCVVAVSACIEAVANRLMFDVAGKHPDGQESGTAVGRINSAGRKLALGRGTIFNTLGGKRPEAIVMELVRVLRNSFVHANEAGAPVDARLLTSAQLASVDEDACRGFLENLRLTAAFVFDQLPWIARPLVTATNVKWLEEIEVP